MGICAHVLSRTGACTFHCLGVNKAVLVKECMQQASEPEYRAQAKLSIYTLT